MNPEKGVKNDKFYYLNHKLLFKNKAEECGLSKALSSTTLNLHIFTLKKKGTWKFDYHSYEFL